MPKTLKVGRLRPIIENTTTALLDVTTAQVGGYNGADLRSVIQNLQVELLDTASSVGQATTPKVRRAALVRLAARSVVLLALDEDLRGARKIMGEAKKYDERGYYDSDQTRARRKSS